METTTKPVQLAMRPRLSPKSASPALTPSISSSLYSISPILSDFVGHLDTDEMQFLEYFRIKAAMAFPGRLIINKSLYFRVAHSSVGPFDGEFWTGLLSQASRREPCIRYAMVAVSSMHRHFLSAAKFGESPLAVVSKSPSTLHYYNKAISALSESISRGGSSTSTILICCILFICLEIIHGDSKAFVGHVRNGQNLIIQWQTKQHQSYGEPKTIAAYNDDNIIKQHLLPFIAQQDAFANCFLSQDMGAEILSVDKDSFTPTEFVPSYFRTLEEARDSLLQINGSVVAFARFNNSAKYTGSFTFADVADLHKLQDKLRLWSKAYYELRQRISSVLGTDQTQSAISAMVEITYTATSIWLATSLTPEQCAFDNFSASFRNIVDLAPRIIDSQIRSDGTDDSHRSTSWGTAIVPQLVFCAMLCRDPDIRRDALGLLPRCVDRYGLWTKPVPTIIALSQRWMDIEESAIPRVSSAPVYNLCFDMGLPVVEPALEQLESVRRLPPESARIHFSRLIETEHSDPRLRTVEFYSKPWGCYDAWYVNTEEVLVT